jgi:superoxide dismutase, Fe-Mn family
MQNKYTIKTFNIPKLKGISEKNIEEHLKLYAGYVNNTNLILEKAWSIIGETDTAYAGSEMQRRLSFEFNGMKNHELFFKSLEDGAIYINPESDLYQKICENFESFENWQNQFVTLAKTRGIGWAMLYYDKESKNLINSWVDEQHLGQLNGLVPILALDMWEHSFVFDYQPSGKPNYIQDFFENLNWSKIEENYNQAIN